MLLGEEAGGKDFSTGVEAIEAMASIFGIGCDSLYSECNKLVDYCSIRTAGAFRPILWRSGSALPPSHSILRVLSTFVSP